MEFRLKAGDALWQKVLRPYLFDKEAEEAHIFTIRALAQIQKRGLLWVLRLLYRSPRYQMPMGVFGVRWRNPVGLAAGFDKHAQVIPALEALGFGSAEIGTVTPQPQPGNTGPRVWRFPRAQAVVNRYGFNSHGAEAVAERLVAPATFRARLRLPIGVSIGKNRATPDEDAVKDYLTAFAEIAWALRPGTDWVKINISSPNTEGLRRTFDRLDEFLAAFVQGARAIAADGGDTLPPFVLKVPPDDLSPDDLARVVEIAARHGFAGIEAINTTVNDEIKRSYGLLEGGKPIPGGVSGEPLRKLATRTVLALHDPCRRTRLDLVGVGGISTGAHAIEKRAAGAVAVQCYTGLVFRGPTLIHEILDAWRQ